jgi:hypothetical protein
MKCDLCGSELNDNTKLMSAPSTKGCGCVCFHFYQQLCPDHLLRKIEKVRRGPLAVDSDAIVKPVEQRGQ